MNFIFNINKLQVVISNNLMMMIKNNFFKLALLIIIEIIEIHTVAKKK